MQAEARATDKILAAAVQLLGERDPDLVTIEQVAAKASLSRGLIVYHFGSFDGLRSVVNDYLLFRLRQLWIQPASVPWGQRLKAWANVLEEEPGLFRLFVNLSLRPSSQSAIDQFREEMVQSIAKSFDSSGHKHPAGHAAICCQWWEGASLQALAKDNRREWLLEAASML